MFSHPKDIKKTVVGLKKKINSYKAHLETERKKALEHFFLESLQNGAKEDPPISSEIKKNMLNAIKKSILPKTATFDDQLNAFCDALKHYQNDDIQQFKKSTLSNYDAYLRRAHKYLNIKWSTILELDKILNSGDEDHNNTYASLNHWYNNSANQIKLNALTTRRGDNLFWNIIDTINNVFKKSKKYSNTGVTGVALTKEMHNQFKSPIKKSDTPKSFQNLLQFVRLSRLVKDETLFQVKHIEMNALHLKEILEKGDATDSIFEDKNCQLYLMYLLRENLINENQFLTTYLYLSALMQFTEKQPIHPDHIGARRLTWGDVKVFTSDNDNILKNYAQNVSNTFDHVISPDEILQFYESLSNNEGWLIGVPYNTGLNSPDDDVKHMMNTNLLFAPILQKISHFNQQYVLVPSISFIKWLLTKLNPDRQMGIAPCFGNIGIDTLYNEFHSQNRHPVTIHSPYIKSNPSRIHDLTAGPVPFALHDIFFHCFGGSAFEVNAFNFMMHCLIPTLQKISDSNISTEAKNMSKKMRDIINDLAFNPNNLIKIKSGMNLQNYLSDRLNSFMYGSNEYKQLNDDKEMQSYYTVLQQLCLGLCDQSDYIQSEYDIDIVDLLNKSIKMNFINDIEFDTQSSHAEAIVRINKLLEDLPISSLPQIEVKRQLTTRLIDHPDICIAINRAGFKFLPPLHPLPNKLLQEVLSSRSTETHQHRSSLSP